MLILSSTTDKIQIVLTGTVSSTQLNCQSVYRDSGTMSITPNRTLTNTNNITPVDLVPSPSTGIDRIVDYISIYNSDTVTSGVTVNFVDNSTSYTLFKVRLATGEKIEYQEKYGFRVITNKLGIKNKTSSDVTNDDNFNVVVLRYDEENQPTVANAGVDVPELKFSVKKGNSYFFRYIIFFDADATTTGARFYITGPSGFIAYQTFTSLTTTTQATVLGINFNEYPFTTAGTTLVAINATCASTTGNMSILEGVCQPNQDGIFNLRFATEVTTGKITVKKGSFLQYIKTI